MDWQRIANVGIDGLRVPARCIDVELSEPLPDVAESHYQFVHLLIRLHGQPVGAIPVQLADGRCPAPAITDAIIERLARQLVRVAVRQAMDRPLATLPLDADLLAQPPAVDDEPLPSITVAVCTRGQSDNLARCIAAVRRLDHPDAEIIVVDNSPDRAAEGVAGGRADVCYLHEPGAGLDRARNRAIVAATRNIIAFTDDDVIVDAGWARAIARRFGASPEVHAVTGLVMPLQLETEPQLMFERYLGFGRGFERRWIEDVDPIPRSIALRHGNTGRLGTGANMAFRRSVLSTIGGFDPALDLGTVTNGGGDLDMFFRVIKAGGMLVYEPTALVRHCHRREWHELEEQLSDWGTAMRSYVERNRLNYPEERLPFAVLLSWLLGTWHVRRLAWSVVDRNLSTTLVLGEIRGVLGGGGRYGAAQRIADAVARRFGPSVPQPRVVTRTTRHASRRSRDVVEHTIDLAEPITPLMLSHPATVRLRIGHEGRAVAAGMFAHRSHTVSASRLRDVTARLVGRAIVAQPAGVRQPHWSEREIAAELLATLQARAEGMRSRAGRSKSQRRSRAHTRR
jgi:glycosyltransferase involved in cell wall biosynthesis